MAKKSGAKGAKLAARTGKVGPRKHYCPECKGDSAEVTSEMEAKPTMFYSPKGRIVFKCKKGHFTPRKAAVLV